MTTQPNQVSEADATSEADLAAFACDSHYQDYDMTVRPREHHDRWLTKKSRLAQRSNAREQK